jgi:ABC-2 type transport system ATP-binding protein
MQNEAVLTFDGVSKRFGAVRAIQELSLSVRAGAVTALLGRNGAGKTTAIRLALGLIKPDAGAAALWGARPSAAPVRRRVAAMLQQAALPDELTVEELLTLFGAYHAKPRQARAIADSLGIAPLLRRRYARLSGGEKRLAQFAVALMGGPDFLILDEPTTGLDMDARAAFWSAVRDLLKGGATVLLTTHYLEEADLLADRILLLHEGRLLADGAPAEIKATIGARRIRCRTSSRPDTIERMAGVTHVSRQGASIDILSHAPEATVRALLAADAALSDLTVTGGDLESAVARLTGSSAGAMNDE